MFKKILSGILALCVALGCAVTAFAEAGNMVASGVCGENLTWELTDDGTLTISGTGDMTSAPWLDMKDRITNLVLNEGLTSVSPSAFRGLSNAVGDIAIPDSVDTIGSYASASYGNGSYTNRKGVLTIGNSVRTIGDHAFYRASLVGDVNTSDSVQRRSDQSPGIYGRAPGRAF